MWAVGSRGSNKSHLTWGGGGSPVRGTEAKSRGQGVGARAVPLCSPLCLSSCGSIIPSQLPDSETPPPLQVPTSFPPSLPQAPALPPPSPKYPGDFSSPASSLGCGLSPLCSCSQLLFSKGKIEMPISWMGLGGGVSIYVIQCPGTQEMLLDGPQEDSSTD